jgi:O-antigen/teichoic acid export membrane protein
MNKSFLTNLLLLVAINVIIKPIFIFGIDRNVQNLVGEHDYGMYFTFLTFCMIMQVIGDAGLQNYNNQQIASGSKVFQDFFPGVMLAKVMVSFVYVILVITGGYLLGYSTDFTLLMWVMVGQLLSGVLLLLRTNISGNGYYRTDSIFSSVDRFLMILFCGYYIWSESRYSDFDIILFAKLQAASYLIALIAVSVWIFLNLPVSGISFPKLGDYKVLKKSMPYALVVLLMIIYSRCDIILLENLLSDGTVQAGIYAAGYRLLDAMNMIGFLAGSLLLPMFAKILNDKHQTEQLYILSFKVLLLFTTLVAVCVILYRMEIMQVLYDNATYAWGNVLGILMVSFISMTLGYVSGCYLTASGKVNNLIRSFILAILINVLLNLILIPHFKVMGVAITSAITQFFILVVQVNRSKHYAGFKFQNQFILNFLMFLTTFVAVSLLVEKFLTINWYYQLIITPIFGLLLAWLFKIIPDEILLAIKERKFFIQR